MITVGLMYLYHLQSVWVHGVLVAALTGTLALTLFLILLLDHPFTGDVRVSPEAFEQALEGWRKTYRENTPRYGVKISRSLW